MAYVNDFLQADDNTTIIPKTRSNCIYTTDDMSVAGKTLDDYMRHHTHNMADIVDLFVDGDGKLLLQNLTVLIDGEIDTVFNGSEAKTLDISLAKLGGAAANHNHDTVYAKLSHTHTEYAPIAHQHTISDITDFPTDIGGGDINISPLQVLFNGFEELTFDGKTSKTLDITANSIGAAEVNHTHTFSDITEFSLDLPKLSFTMNGIDGDGVDTTTTIEYDGSAEVVKTLTADMIGASRLGHVHNTYALTSHTHELSDITNLTETYYTKSEVDAIVATLNSRIEALESV